MGGLSPAEERLTCNCQACLAWRRCGSLLGGFHAEPERAQRAAAILRHAVCELSDLIEIHPSGSGPPLAGGRSDPSVTPARGVGTEESGSRSRSRRGVEGGGGLPSGHKGPTPEREEKEEDPASPKESKPKKTKKKDRSRRRRSRSRRREEKKAATPTRSPLRSPRGREASAPLTRVKEERVSEEEGPLEPPGRWTLTEAPTSSSTTWQRGRLPGSARPPEPSGPPPGWVTRSEGGFERKSKGVVRRERARDINIYGFNQARKKQREHRRDACAWGRSRSSTGSKKARW
jgi:hypothetical protein